MHHPDAASVFSPHPAALPVEQEHSKRETLLQTSARERTRGVPGARRAQVLPEKPPSLPGGSGRSPRAHPRNRRGSPRGSAPRLVNSGGIRSAKKTPPSTTTLSPPSAPSEKQQKSAGRQASVERNRGWDVGLTSRVGLPKKALLSIAIC